MSQTLEDIRSIFRFGGSMSSGCGVFGLSVLDSYRILREAQSRREGELWGPGLSTNVCIARSQVGHFMQKWDKVRFNRNAAKSLWRLSKAPALLRRKGGRRARHLLAFETFASSSYHQVRGKEAESLKGGRFRASGVCAGRPQGDTMLSGYGT